MATAETPDFLDLELDNYVSPDAANDQAPDDALDLELDLPEPALDATSESVEPALDATSESVEPYGYAQAAVDALPSESPATIETDLAAISEQATANASVQTIGSLNGGGMRYVGFDSAEGYINALAHGVKAGTANEYKQILCQSYGYAQAAVDALPCVIIPEADLPVGQGTTVLPEGVTAETYVAPVFNKKTAAERRAMYARPISESGNVEDTKKAPLLAAGTLIANLVKDGRGIAVSPGRADRRHTLVAAGEITIKLGERFAHLAPRIKSNKAQFGEVMRSLKAGGLVTTAVTRKDVTRAGDEWPQDLASRWIVGYLDGSDVLGKLGDKVLIADLLKDDTIRFTGGSDTLRQRVTDAFTTRCGERTFNATDMLNWFRAILMNEFNSVSWGGFYYVPGNPEATQPCRDFVACAKTLLGRSVAVGEVTSDAGLVEGLGEGLLDEVQEIKDLYDVAQVKASEREIAKHLKANPGDTAGAELAARRAVVLPEAAGTFVRRLNDTQDRINGYATMLGDDAVKAARELLASLRATIEPLCDGTSAMAANIELE